ncbi:MAG TPA: hypothetical protein VMV94_15680 [Phycisphaerae bacterium]|nr:hypothetical protein [Phycisphaerae bacterium]
MTFAKKMLMLVLIVVLAAPIFGCGSVGATPAYNRRAASRVVDYDARMFVDDITLFSQLDRPFRGSRWVID